MGRYIAEQTWTSEAERLSALGRALDPTAIRHLERLGVGRRASCLAVGAGAGSIAAWMCERVGATGRVVAWDLDTTLLAPLEAQHANLVVEERDVLTDESNRPAYDFVHARLVVGHVPDKLRAIGNMFRAARPRGWLLIEDADFLWTRIGARPIYPARYAQPYFRVWFEAVEFMAKAGYGVHWGGNAVATMRELAPDEVAGEATTLIGSSDLTMAMRLTIRRFGALLVQTGRISSEELASFDELMSDPEVTFTRSPIFSVWGRRGPSMD